MRIVRFSPQERVDGPDITAMSHLVAGEFRRTIRAALLGPAIGGLTKASNLMILRGFPVTASAVPDAIVTITIDPGGGLPLSAAFLGEDMASHIDTGHLAGGEDSGQRLEGNALGTVDFTGLAPDDYIIEMRALLTTGASDNRVFRRESDGTYFVSRTFTRFLPTLEFRAVPSTTSGDDWMTLAGVAWTGPGGTVAPADITDGRLFAVEGIARFYQTSDGDQDSFSALGDFDRDVDRSTVGVNEVYPAIRAGHRQVRDLKGPTWVDGVGFKWDWFSRPLPPKDYAAAGLPFGDEHTKHLGSVETTTYTIGDGFNTHGDFNGASGLQQALEALDGTANPLGRPRRVRIVLKGDTRASITQVVTTPFDFDVDGDLHITIEAVSANEAYGDKGLAEVEFTGAGNDFHWIKCRGITLENVSLRSTTMRQGLLDVREAVIRNSVLQTTPDTVTYADLSGGNHALTCDQGSLTDGNVLIERTTINGPLRLTDYSSDFVTALNRGRQARILGCTFGTSGMLLLNDLTQAGSAGLRSSSGLLVEGCSFASTLDQQTNTFGMVDGRTAQNVVFRDCQFVQATRNSDMIHLGEGGGDLPEANWLIDNCLFRTSTVRSSAFELGTNGADGTGWCIFHKADAWVTDTAEDESSIRVRGCSFEGPGNPTVQDSGAVYANNTAHLVVSECQFFNWSSNDNSRVRLISLIATSKHCARIENNRFFAFVTPAVGAGELCGLYANGYDNFQATGNDMKGLTAAGGSFLQATTLSAAIRVIGCSDFTLDKNHVEGWQGVGAGIWVGSTVVANTCQRFLVTRNTLHLVADQVAGRFAIIAEEGGGGVVRDGTISGNLILSAANGNGIDVSDTDNMLVNDNNIQIDASGTTDGIVWGTGPTNCMCSGNRINGGTITGSGVGVVYGFMNSTRDDLNF